jgi:DNA-binding NtrC family response regulator
VDDDEGMRFFLSEALRKEGYACDTAADGREALSKLETDRYPIILMDIKMPKLSGLATLTEIKRLHPDHLVILMTAYGSKKVALEAMEKGAYDYFTKPFDLDEMRVVLKRAAERFSLQEELIALRRQVEGFRPPIIGQSEPMRRVLELVDKVAANDMTVLITGESGTGKELIARAIHDQSVRRSGPFVVVNCAAIPEGLLESELFGHEKGAFTGAHQQKPGTFELAHRGTVFLDEIGEMPPTIQTKLLRVLQEREVTRVGGLKPIPVDVRFIAATNRNLSQAVSAGGFREDLFFRLNVFRIELPALRDRLEDIPALTDYFLQRYSAQLKKRITEIGPEAMEILNRYHWPGNIRELENVLQRAMILTQGDRLDERVIQGILTSGKADEPHDSNLKLKVEKISTQAEKRMIEAALREEHGKRTATAKRLGISRKNLYNKMRRYGLL